jgi:hypothetical protein
MLKARGLHDRIRARARRVLVIAEERQLCLVEALLASWGTTGRSTPARTGCGRHWEEIEKG